MLTIRITIQNTPWGRYDWFGWLRYHKKGKRRDWSRNLGRIESPGDYKSVRHAMDVALKTAERLKADIAFDKINIVEWQIEGGQKRRIIRDEYVNVAV